MRIPQTFEELIDSCRGNDKTAFRTSKENEKITFNRFFCDCMKEKERIAALPYSNVAICEKESYRWIVRYFGVQLAGKTAILINPDLLPEEILSVCRRYSAYLPGYALTRASLTPSVSLGSTNGSSHISTVIFTSGTEGEPKGVALSECGILSSVTNALQYLGIRHEDVIIHTLPFYHAFGLAAEVTATIVMKTTLCFGNGMGTLPRDIPFFSATVMFAVPSVIKGLFSIQQKYLSLRKIIAGSASVDDEIIAQMPDHITLHCSYGLSECSPVVAVSLKGDKMGNNYAGRILQCCKISIAKDGEICVSGKNVMLGYYDGKTLDRESVRTGIFCTGDLGYVSGDRLFVTGRKKNLMVFSDGENIGVEALEKKIAERLETEDCYVWQYDSSHVNVILYCKEPIANTTLISECLPLGVNIKQIYIRTKPFIVNSLNKKIRNITCQLQ